MKNFTRYIVESWKNTEGNVNSTNELLLWINNLNSSTYVNVNETKIVDNSFWFYDDYNGEILNRKRSFFSIRGIRLFSNDILVKEQPIIIQPEIGYLGIICKIIGGTLNFLMQAKIEPGNVNCVQISPTIQATKSNFTRVHGGKLPNYFSYFENASKYRIIYDQIQSEQAARFLKKRNRNMIIMLDEEIEILPNFKWMTLGQIKSLMKIDNLVNMDTRTVLSGLPFVFESGNDNLKKMFNDIYLYNSIFHGDIQKYIVEYYQKINDYKMFSDTKTVLIPLNQLVDWQVDESGVECKYKSDFSVKYYNIEIHGREVQNWTQPLFKANGQATFGLATCVENSKRLFLVQIMCEIGSFDKGELGPTVQWEPTHSNDNDVDSVFRLFMNDNNKILLNVTLSEEGGRFYHEQNVNIIIECNKNDFGKLPKNYIWVDFATLNYLVQINNCLNIQLRNLISLIQL